MNEFEEILIIGARSALSHAFARLAVAYGLEPIWSREEAPDGFEPWHAAITWKADPLVAPPGSDKLVIAIVFDEEVVEGLRADRWVFVHVGSGRQNGSKPANSHGIVEIMTGSLHQEDPLVEVDHASFPVAEPRNHVEVAAIAILRCALEFERSGTISPQDVAVIGDAMMLQ